MVEVLVEYDKINKRVYVNLIGLGKIYDLLMNRYNLHPNEDLTYWTSGISRSVDKNEVERLVRDLEKLDFKVDYREYEDC
jgi:hypothetical protein